MLAYFLMVVILPIPGFLKNHFMKRRKLLLYVLFFSLLMHLHLKTNAQNKNGNGIVVAGTRPPDETPVEGQPWEHRDTYGKGQKPAFAGQTRIGAVITKTPYKEEVITASLYHPWGLAFMPDGRMLITEKRGTMRIVTQKGLVSDTLRGLPRDILYAGDAGLLDIALDPDFKNNRIIYFTYSQKRPGGSGLVVASARLSDDEFSVQNVKIIYNIQNTSPSNAHY